MRTMLKPIANSLILTAVALSLWIGTATSPQAAQTVSIGNRTAGHGDHRDQPAQVVLRGGSWTRNQLSGRRRPSRQAVDRRVVYCAQGHQARVATAGRDQA